MKTEFINGKFAISISNQIVNDKNTFLAGSLTWTKKTINLTSLIDYIKEGHAFCGVFTDSFAQTFKKQCNWKGSFFIGVDCDDMPLKYDEFMTIIKESDICPNIAYRTANDGIKGNRYRLIYVFDEMIENSILFTHLYECIEYKIRMLFHIDKFHDSCGSGIERFFYPTNHVDDIFYNELYYDFKSISDREFVINTSDYEKRQKEAKKHKENTIERKEFRSFDFTKYDMLINEFADDFQNMKFEELISKYVKTYPNKEHTDLPIVSEDDAVIVLPSDYVQINRNWYVGVNEKTDNRISNIRKIKDGEGRRKTLFKNALIRRKINPNITFDNLLFNILCEFDWYMINNGNKIYRKDIYEIAENAYNTDLKKYDEYFSKIRNKYPKMIANTDYCVKYGVTKKQAVAIGKKQITYKKIGDMYDFLLSDKENLKVMKENGLNICNKTLQRWKRENCISKIGTKVDTTNYKERERNIIGCKVHFSKIGTKEHRDNEVIRLHNEGMSLRSIAVTLNISKNTANKIIKEYTMSYTKEDDAKYTIDTSICAANCILYQTYYIKQNKCYVSA